MLRLLSASLFAIVLSAFCLTSTAPAQVSPPAGEAVTEAQLEAGLRNIDPNLQVERKDNGETVYRLRIRVGQDMRPLFVISNASKIMVFMPVSPAVRLEGSELANVEQKIREINPKIAPTALELVRNNDGSVVMVAVTVIERPITAQALGARFGQFGQVIDSLNQK